MKVDYADHLGWTVDAVHVIRTLARALDALEVMEDKTRLPTQIQRLGMGASLEAIVLICEGIQTRMSPLLNAYYSDQEAEA